MEMLISYDEILEKFPTLSPAYLKTLQTKYEKFSANFIYQPPYLIITDSSIDAEAIKFVTLLNLYLKIQSNNLEPQSQIEFLDSYYFVVRYEENLIILKNGDDDALIFRGPFFFPSIIVLGIFKNISAQKLKLFKFVEQIKMTVNEYCK